MTIDKAKRFTERKNQELNKSFESLAKRLDNLQREMRRGSGTATGRSKSKSRKNSVDITTLSPIQEFDEKYKDRQEQIINRIISLEQDLDKFRSN